MKLFSPEHRGRTFCFSPKCKLIFPDYTDSYLTRDSRNNLVQTKIFPVSAPAIATRDWNRLGKTSTRDSSVCGIMSAIHHATSSSSLAALLNLQGSRNYTWSFQLLSLKPQGTVLPLYEPTVLTSISWDQQLPLACNSILI
jgi:hypothetical protein